MDWTRFSNPSRYGFTRESHLPPELRGTPPYVPAGTDLAVWSWDDRHGIHAIAFQGKADKPLWHYRFRKHVDRESRIEETAASRRAELGRKQERQATRRAFQHSLKVGDILSSHWGYDQSNVDFYEVVEAKGKSVVICEIGKSVVRSEQNADYVVPVPGTCSGEPMRKVVGEGNYVRLTSFSSARPWDGKPEYETASGWGH